MSKIQSAPGISNQKDAMGVGRATQQFATDVQNLVNGQLSYVDNFKAQLIGVTFLAANTDQAVPHNLNSLPTGYQILRKSVTLDVYDGSQNVFQTSYVTLRSTAIGFVTLMIF